MLFIGIIALDAGMLSLSLQDSPREFMIFYLLGTFAFSGLVDVLRARESRRVGARSWRLTLIIGAINLALAIFAGVFGFALKKTDTVSYIYGAGLVYSGIIRIISAFRRTEIVYIQ